MKEISFILKTEFIELFKLLKVTGIFESGRRFGVTSDASGETMNFVPGRTDFEVSM